MRSKPKILNVTFTTRKGGLEQVFLDYSNILSTENNVINIVHTKSPLLKYKVNCGIWHDLSVVSKYDPIAWWKLRKIISAEKPDIIITHGNRAHYLTQKASTNIPIVGVAHVYSFDHILSSDYIIAVSESIKCSIIERGYDANRVSCINNMINWQKCSTTSKAFSRMETIGMIGRLEFDKGGDLFIKALSILKDKGYHLKAVIAGSGSEEDRLKALANNFGVELELLGWINEQQKFYDKIDILCVPSRSEPFGLVVIEGMMYGKPVVASYIDGIADIITDEEDGIFFESNNPESLALSIAKVITDSSLAKKLRKNGVITSKKYDFSVAGKNLKSFISSLVL